MEEALIELVQAFKKVPEEVWKWLKRLWIKITEHKDKLIKYKKYQKRVLNRKKLFAKRKAKYGR